MLSGYPPRPDAAAALAALVTETEDIPMPWLLEGLRKFRDDPERTFSPTLPEIRTACARSIATHRAEARGDSVPQLERLPVGRVIAWAAKHSPLGLSQLATWARAEKDRLRHEAGEDGDRSHETPSAGTETPPTPEVPAEGILERLMNHHKWERIPTVPILCAALRDDGVHVPPRLHPDEIHATCGALAATVLARHLTEYDRWPRGWGPDDYGRMARAMELHRRAAGTDVGWWDECREELRNLAERN